MRYEIALEETLGVGSKKLINCDETKINNPADNIPVSYTHLRAHETN